MGHERRGGVRVTIPKRQTGDDRLPDAAAAGWRSYYELEDAGAIDAFVGRHPFLITLLERAPSAIEVHFGEHRGLRLETVADPDAEGAEHLYLFVRTEWPFEEAYERQRRLEEGWWLDAMLGARGALTVGIEHA